MKIGTISDLHIDRHSHLNPEIYLEKLCQVIKQRSIELLIIAGDISNDYRISYMRRSPRQLPARSPSSTCTVCPTGRG